MRTNKLNLAVTFLLMSAFYCFAGQPSKLEIKRQGNTINIATGLL